MIIRSKRFGDIDVKDDRIIHFKEGLLGFPTLKRFFLADDPHDMMLPFKWLIAVDAPDTAFLVTDPGIFFKDYVFDLPEDDRSKIAASSEDDISVITLLTVPAEPKKITANLRGPLVINWKTLVGRQLVLKETSYTTKHFIFIQENPEAKAADSSKSTDVSSSQASAAPSTSATNARPTA